MARENGFFGIWDQPGIYRDSLATWQNRLKQVMETEFAYPVQKECLIRRARRIIEQKKKAAA
jgi:hypothetical protein